MDPLWEYTWEQKENCLKEINRDFFNFAICPHHNLIQIFQIWEL
jgi:hypothetical protein